MTKKLAIFANDLGASFINFHLTDLLPNHTVAVGVYGNLPITSIWPVKCPYLNLDGFESSFQRRVSRRLFGIDDDRARLAITRKFLNRHRVTHVLGEYLDHFVDLAPLMDELAIPYVVQAHGYDVSQQLRDPAFVTSLSNYRNARAILTRSKVHRQRLIALGMAPEKVHVNIGGVTVPERCPDRFKAKGHRFLAVGRMVPKKGPMYLLESFRILATRDPDVTLDWIGGGEYFCAVRQSIRAAGFTNRIRLHDYAPESLKQNLLNECGTFVQHSITDPETGDEEGLPAAIQEAMAQGLAVVSTRHAGIPEAVVDGVTGLLVDEGDVSGMAGAMAVAKTRFREFGEAGYAEAVAKHDWRFERDRLIRLIFGENRIGY